MDVWCGMCERLAEMQLSASAVYLGTGSSGHEGTGPHGRSTQKTSLPCEVLLPLLPAYCSDWQQQ